MYNAHNFLTLALRVEALKFGRFTLKSGRVSPYFFNAGAFCDGESLAELARCYARAIVQNKLQCDCLFGPAYKGIPLVSAVACALYREFDVSYPWAFNRKEAKDHGEGGSLVGARLRGRVLIIDDVVTAGTAIHDSVRIIREAGADIGGIILALDRQERATHEELSCVAELQAQYQVPVVAIARLDDLLTFLDEQPELHDALDELQEYRSRYSV